MSLEGLASLENIVTRGDWGDFKLGFDLAANICNKSGAVAGVQYARKQRKEPGIRRRLVKSVLGGMVTKGGEWQRGPIPSSSDVGKGNQQWNIGPRFSSPTKIITRSG